MLVRIDGEMNGCKFRRFLEENFLEAAKDWGGGSPSSKIATPNTQTDLQWNGIKQTIFIS